MEERHLRERRAAENQALFRSVNERIRELNEVFDLITPHGSWTCECSRIDCIRQLEMTLAEYEAVRAAPGRFAVAPTEDHVDPELERVVERTERYWVVERLGAGVEPASALGGRWADRSHGGGAVA